MQINQPRILVLDIETKPATAHVWGLFKQNVAINQLIDPGGILCVGLKWHGEEGAFFFSEWEHGHQLMMEGVHELISHADAVVTYNGDRFDLTKLRGQFLLAGLDPPPPVTSIDLYKTVKKLGLISGKLGFVGPYFGLGEKEKHEGFGLWTAVMAGDEAARERMRNYCLQDVELTSELYSFVLSYIPNHPNLGYQKPDTCGACGSSATQKRGFRRTKFYRIQRVQCQNCGSWSDGTRQKVTASDA